MEISNISNSGGWEMDDPLQWPLVSIGDLGSFSFGSPFGHDDPHHPFSPDHEPAPERAKYESSKPSNHLTSSSSTGAFHFNDGTNPARAKLEAWTLDFSSESVVSESSSGNKNYGMKPCQGAERASTNTRPKDNVLAERKRREKLGQRFIDLSALVPSLKKMDKASILGDAIKHTKQLQERVKILELQSKKKSLESVVFVKRSHLHCSENNVIAEAIPEIEARFSDNDVLINIQCEKRNGLLEKTVAEIEKLHLSVVNSSVMAFGDSALYMVVMAKKDEDSTMNTKEVVQNLCAALKAHLK